MSPQELLNNHGIKLASYEPGEHSITCPECSKDRNKKTVKCLDVKIEADDRVCWNCHHCSWSGPPKGGGERKRDEWPTFVYRDAGGVERFRKVRRPPKSFFIQHPDGKGGWAKGGGGADLTLIYRANEVATAIAAGREICIAEGEKDADSLWRLDIPATCNAHGASEPGNTAKWKQAHSAQLAGADIVVLNDNDSAGYEHADTACKLSLGIAKRVRRLDLKNDWPEIPKGGDVSDWLAVGGEHTPERLRELIEAAPEIASPEKSADAKPEQTNNGDADDAELERLAKLSALEYGRARKEAAKRLGTSVQFLDIAVKAKRTELGIDEPDGLRGRPLTYDEPEPWPVSVSGEQILDEIAAGAGRFIVLPPHAAEIIALWLTHSYLLDTTDITPRLQICSPVKRCGKSTALDYLFEHAYRPQHAANITAAATFRLIDEFRPTLLIDEADTFLPEAEELSGVLNSGHHVRGSIPRAVPVGDDYQVRSFSTFAAVAIALIGQLEGKLATLGDRAITITLARRKSNETVESFSAARRRGQFKPVCRRLMRWAQDNREALAVAEPAIPEGINNDRAVDNWRPLLAIADAVSGKWPEKAREILKAMAATSDDSEAGSLAELLLSDIRDIFDETRRDRISFAELIEHLVKLPLRPWGAYGKSGKPLTQHQFAYCLRPFRLTRRQWRIGEGEDGDRVRGYERNDLENAFERYLPPKPQRDGVTEPDFIEQVGDSVSVTPESRHTEKTRRNPIMTGLVTPSH
jgi:putative DNA primase/helicase